VLAEGLRPYLDLPFAFFGHSMGALIAFELARHLARRQARGPMHLFVSGRAAPQLPDEGPPIHHREYEAFVEELRHLNGTPAEVLQNPELLELLLPRLRADFALCETYRCPAGPPLRCPLTAFGGLEDDVTREELRAWESQTVGPFTLQLFPGDHFFLHRSRQGLVEAIVQALRGGA
jgi:medium-chain acyl-[acyl-carrier-protein] hydrolase